MDTVSPSQTFMDVRQVSELVGISKSSLDKMRLSGRGPAYARIGTRVVYRRSDVESWVAGQLQHSTAENRTA